MANLTPILDSTKISLERAAADKFGAAVEQFATNTIGPALGVTPTSTAGTTVRPNDGSFYSSSYAAALAGGTSYRPKLKFLFKVEFVFTEAAKSAFPDVLGAATSQDFTFMIKSVDLPKIDFEYEEDVNMYNFRTKALKKIRHRELTLTLMNDTGNRVLNFFRAVMMLHSPITRRQMIRQNATSYEARIAAPLPLSIQEGNGMNFSAANDAKTNDTAIRGTVESTVGNVIQSIRVKQIYVNPGAQLGAAVEETIFDFLNARLVSFDLDDLSHESSDANLVTMQFDYDWMEIVQVGALTKNDSPNYNIAVPGVHGAPSDISPAGTATTSSGGGNVFTNIITNQLGRAAQSITSSAINRAVTTIAGKGQFASLIGSQTSNILGGLVGAASKNLGSSLINQAGASFKSMNVITPPNASPAGTTSVMDSTSGGRSDVSSVVTTSFDSDLSGFTGD